MKAKVKATGEIVEVFPYNKDGFAYFNFKLSVCTSIEQSRRLLSLGLKKETADIIWLDQALTDDYEDWRAIPIYKDWEEWQKDGIPAWSLGRLIETMPYYAEMYNKAWCLQVSKGYVRYAQNGKEKSYIGFIRKPNTFDAIIDCIEWLIKEGQFDKEYLV